METDKQYDHRGVLGAWRKAYWREVIDYIAERNPPFRLQSPGTNMSTNIAVGRTHFSVALTLIPKRKVIGCELYTDSPNAKEAFSQLFEQRDAIEAEIGERLQWKPLPAKAAARILLETEIDPADEGNHQRVKEWMYQHALTFHKVFQPRVKALKL